MKLKRLGGFLAAGGLAAAGAFWGIGQLGARSGSEPAAAGGGETKARPAAVAQLSAEALRPSGDYAERMQVSVVNDRIVAHVPAEARINGKATSLEQFGVALRLRSVVSMPDMPDLEGESKFASKEDMEKLHRLDGQSKPNSNKLYQEFTRERKREYKHTHRDAVNREPTVFDPRTGMNVPPEMLTPRDSGSRDRDSNAPANP